MNNKGFTLMEMLTVLVVITIIMMITVPIIINISKKNSDEMYASYEDMMEEYAKVSDKKNENLILLDDLEGLQKVKDECKGYVENKNNNYKAYIKCPKDTGDKYITEGYNNNIN